jgi:hypothetical protein
MFLHETGYRLGDFILIESGSISLTWLLQYPMGMQRSGKCYIIDDILVLMHWDQYVPGYLRMEFHEHLMKLPTWHKTAFYCFASSLRKVVAEGMLANNMIEQLAANASTPGSTKTIEPGYFRLGRHKITADDNNTLAWQSIGPHNKIVCGICFIESGILLFDSKKEELEEVARRSFYSELKLLRPWNATSAWGYAASIIRCKNATNNMVHETLCPSESTMSLTIDRIPLSVSHRPNRETLSELNTPKDEHRKIELQVIVNLTILTIKKVHIGLRIGVLVSKKMIDYVANILALFPKIHTKNIEVKDE